ncbi:hypothetical protein TIFTF001_055999, partial [Ficus carica]
TFRSQHGLGRDQTGLDWTERWTDWIRFGWKRGHWTGRWLSRALAGFDSAGTVRALAGQQQWWNGQWLKWWCGVAARLGSLARRRGRNWAVSAAGDGQCWKIKLQQCYSNLTAKCSSEESK